MSEIEKSMRRQRRKLVYERDEQECVWCGKWFFSHMDERITFDHIIPASKNGSWWWQNIMLSCGTCNSKRGNMSAKEYIAICKKQGKKIKEQHIRDLLAHASSTKLCYKTHYASHAIRFRFDLMTIEEFLAS